MPSEVKDDLIDTRPGAPALEKGLDVLEVLAAEKGGVTQKQLAERLGRSVGEIFRMLGVLERRGYIAREAPSGAYVLTLQLFQLATQHPPTKRLQQAALPALEWLAESSGFSSHLSVTRGEQFLVLAEAESLRSMGWRVRLGATFPLSAKFASARVLSAFQREARRAELARLLAHHAGAQSVLVAQRLEMIREAGYEVAESEVTTGLHDLCAPVLDHSGIAVAVVVLPFLQQLDQSLERDALLPMVCEAARRITLMIGGVTNASS